MKTLPNYFLIFLILVSGLISCKESKVDKEGQSKSVTEKNLITFDLKEMPQPRQVKLSELGAIDIEYIPLKSNNQNTITNITDVIISKNYFLTRGLININMFSYAGTHVTEVGTQGRGPNEFITISDVDIDPVSESIYISDGLQPKFLVFDKRGKAVRTIKSPITGQMRFRFNTDGILCYYLNHDGNIADSYILIDTTGTIIEKFPNRYPWRRDVPGGAFEGENFFYRFNSQLFKKEIYSDTIFMYKNKRFEPYKIIDVGKQRLTPQARSKVSNNSEASLLLKNYINPFNLFEFGDFIYYEFGVTMNGVFDLKSYIGSKESNFNALIVPYEGLINDLDGGPNIWPKTVKDDNTVVSWIEALKFKEYISSEAFVNSTPKYPEKKIELVKLANSLEETDNPVLILVKLKK